MRFRGLVLGVDGQSVMQVRQALHTDSRAEAICKAVQVEAERLAEWEALAAGEGTAARAHFAAARQLAAAKGFSYVPIDRLAAGDLDEIKTRLDALFDASGALVASRAAAEAITGTVPEVSPTLSEVLTEYFDLTKTRHLQKSERQLHRWKLPRERAVKNFTAVLAHDPQIAAITRADALEFRKWWSERVEGGMAVGSANKDFGHLSEIIGTWAQLTDTAIQNPFARLRLDGRDEGAIPAFSREWVLSRLLADGALAGLNPQARDVLLMMINTGLRPSEITDAPAEDFEVSAEIPFFRVAPHGRELKVQHTRRDIPLLGVSLAAAKRLAVLGGVPRYRHNAGSWLAAVNKYLRGNGLMETPKHVAYSLRHYVENALLAAGVDDRIRADILGHKYHRPNYGDGGYLAGRREALERIAL